MSRAISLQSAFTRRARPRRVATEEIPRMPSAIPPGMRLPLVALLLFGCAPRLQVLAHTNAIHSIALDDHDVFFAADDGHGRFSVLRIPKNGGDVDTIVPRIDWGSGIAVGGD